MRTNLPQYNCISTGCHICTVADYTVHTAPCQALHKWKRTWNERGGKKGIRWPSYANPWLKSGSLWISFLEEMGWSHIPQSQTEASARCRSHCSSCFFLIKGLWKLCRENSWWWVCERQNQARDGNEPVALPSAKCTECARTPLERRQTATCGIWLAFTNVASGWSKKNNKSKS